MYLMESSSPLEPGARPSNSSEARVLICASNASGVMTSSAGFSFSAGLSAAKRGRAISKKRKQEKRNVFITEKVVAVLVSSNELKRKALGTRTSKKNFYFAFFD